MKNFTLTTALGVAVILSSATAQAGPIFAGNLFFTDFSGVNNVNSVTYSYDQGTQILTLGSAVNVAKTPGADGIIFAPNGDLLVGGQGNGKVYDVNPVTGTFTSVSPGSVGADQNSFHLALDPSGAKFYTSDFGGPLDIVPLPFGTQGATRTVSGSDTGVTQIAFAPTTGDVFYVDGQPNGFGNIGFINLTTGITTRIFSGVQPAHGLIFDPFTGLMTMFGDGEVGTFDQSGTVGSLKTSASLNCDFDQGAVDGHGHALVAGCNDITFIDYSISHDITHPDKVIIETGFANIDDVAPLVGAGSNTVPEPSSLLLVGAGIVALVVRGKNAVRRKN